MAIHVVVETLAIVVADDLLALVEAEAVPVDKAAVIVEDAAALVVVVVVVAFAVVDAVVVECHQ